MRRRRQIHLSPIAGAKERKCLMDYSTGNEALERAFPKLKTFSKSFEPLSRNRDPNTTQIEHVYAICCGPEVADTVISN